MRKLRPPIHASGFTLAELLVSILILSIIASLAYQSLTSIMRSKNLLDNERDLTMIANSVLGRLTREFQLSNDSQLLPPGGEVQNSYPSNTSFIGEDKKMGAGHDGDAVTFMADEAGQYVPGQTH
ncbi:MAG: type II secretion system protein, partial [Bdellovibrionales bacterium]|nr:type II secretion system protein [Bdellovibrionales bacterium]